MTTRAAVAVAAVVLVTAGGTGCSASAGHSPHATSTGSGSGVATPSGPSGVAAGVPATRWWSNSAARAGSVVDAAHPLAAAARLHPSRTDYCGMLRQTVAAGRSILPGATAGDPALLATTTAFVGELQRVAPGPLAAAWTTVGRAAVALVSTGGTPSANGTSARVDPAAVGRAAKTIATDARSHCGLDLSHAPAR